MKGPSCSDRQSILAYFRPVTSNSQSHSPPGRCQFVVPRRSLPSRQPPSLWMQQRRPQCLFGLSIFLERPKKKTTKKNRGGGRGMESLPCPRVVCLGATASNTYTHPLTRMYSTVPPHTKAILQAGRRLRSNGNGSNRSPMEGHQSPWPPLLRYLPPILLPPTPCS